jgi:hypothetical protein
MKKLLYNKSCKEAACNPHTMCMTWHDQVHCCLQSIAIQSLIVDCKQNCVVPTDHH